MATGRHQWVLWSKHPVCLGEHVRPDALSWPQVSPLWKSSGSLPCCPPTASSTRPWRIQRPLTAQSQDGCCATGPVCSVSWGCFLVAWFLGFISSYTALGYMPGGGDRGITLALLLLDGLGGIDRAIALHHMFQSPRPCGLATPCRPGGLP